MNLEDAASDLTDRENESIIARARAKAAIKKFPITGQCYSCEAPLTDRVFCDADCRDDYEYITRRRNG
jgi:hypothetical protein